MHLLIVNCGIKLDVRFIYPRTEHDKARDDGKDP